MKRIALFLPATVTIITAGCTPSGDPVIARNIEVVHMVFSEIWSKGRVELIDELFADDFVGHFPARTVHGREGVLDRVTAHRMAFPDWTEEPEDTVADGDRVVVRFTSRGTNLGDFLGNPPTGNRVEISEVAIFRLSEGKIVEQWVYPDMLSLQRQLGQNEPRTGMDAERLRELGARYTVAWNSHDAAGVAAFHNENGSLKVNEGEPAVGREAIAAVARGFMTAFPDMVLEMDSLRSAGSTIEYHWTFSGTNTGPDGTGHAVRFSGYEEWTIGEDGLIAASLGHFDEAEYNRQLEFGVDGS